MSKLLSRGLMAGIAMTALSGAISLSLTGNAQAYQCKPNFVSATWHRANAEWALALAKAAWSEKVKQQYGLAWSVWKIAKAKSQKCVPKATGVECTVKAKPCLYVVP